MSAGFFALALAMLLVASGFIVWPLWQGSWRGSGRGSGRESGRGSPALAPRRRSAAVLSGAVAFASIAGYAVVGQPRAWLQPELLEPVAEAAKAVPPNADAPSSSDEAPLSGQPQNEAGDPSPANAGGISPAQIEAMVQRLAQRLQGQPDDVKGWRMLARSYETLRRFDEAAHAYQRIIALSQPNADLLLDYAVALGMSHGQTLAGEPEAVLGEALKLQPAHPQALALSGSAAFERQDYARAIGRWQKLLEGIPADAEMRPAIQANIDKARALSKAAR